MTQKDLYEKLKNNPLQLPVYFAQDTISKGEDFVVFERVNNNGTYADDSLYSKSSTIQVMIYCVDVDDINTMAKWCQNELNTLADFGNEDLYYTATLTKQLFIEDWIK